MRNHSLSRVRTTDITLAMVLLLAMVSSAVDLTAQETNSRWLPWFGCWDAVAEDAPMVCFMPFESEEGVELVTVVDGEISSREVILANGVDQPVEREGCEGWERAEFSQDDRRVYFQSELTCADDVPSNSTGVMSLRTPFEWIDVKSVEVDGESAPFVMRYTLASAETVAAVGLSDVTAGLERSLRSARYRASSAVTIENVLDVHAHMDTEGLEAWVAETNQEFDIDAESLVHMADSGMPEAVIDLMVALSFPGEFAIDRGPNGLGGSADEDERIVDRSRYGVALGFYGGYYNDPFFMGRYYSSYYGYRYSPYGYGPIYGYGGYGVYGPTVVVVTRVHQGDGATNGRGRVIRGQGYSSGSRGSSASSRGSSSSSGSSGSSARSGSSSSGSSRSTGRKAKRRGGGY